MDGRISVHGLDEELLRHTWGGAAPLRKRESDGPVPTPTPSGAWENDAEDKNRARMFVQSLPTSCTRAELRALIRQIEDTLPGVGDEEDIVLECRVLEGRGCGFIQFITFEAAEACIDALHERHVNEWEDPVKARWATPRGGKGKASGQRDA